MAMRYRATAAADRGPSALEVTQWVRDVLDVDDDTVVSVAHHRCGDPDCDEASTTILIMRPGHPTAPIIIPKPLERVARADVCAAIRRCRT
jgi:hypothetical protein